jgi:Polyketide cyclase / dehydrase and lipid transport
MTTLVTAHAASTATPHRFFARWADMATWPEWNTDTEWVRLDGPFQTGSTGVLKPRGGPKTRFTIASVVEGREFVDVSHLLGASLTFRHTVTERADGGCEVDVTIDLAGPLGWFWKAAIGKGLRTSVQPDLDRLVATAESDAAADQAAGVRGD